MDLVCDPGPKEVFTKQSKEYVGFIVAIPPEMSILQYYNSKINDLVKLRDKYMTYDDDWATLPQAVKTAIKARVSQVITDVKLGLDDVNQAAQDRV